MSPTDLHERLELLRAGEPPLPLTTNQATAQAARLRSKHFLSYNALARVMGEYHGVWLGEDAWRYRCRTAGCVPRPRGVHPGADR